MQYRGSCGALGLTFTLVAVALSQTQPPVAIASRPLAQDEVARMTGHEEQVVAVAFSPDGRRALSGSGDGTVCIWDVPAGTLVRRIPVSWQQILAIAYSPDGRLLAFGGVDNLIRLWDPQTGEEIRQLTGSSKFVTALAFSPDGKRLLSAAGDRKVRLWDPATGEELRIYDQTMAMLKSVAFSPDGGLALCSGGGYSNRQNPEPKQMLRVWHLASGAVLFRLEPKVQSVILKAAFSPDSRRVAAIDVDANGLGVWDLEKRERVHLLRPTGSIQDLAFTPDGRFILSSNSSNTLVLNEIESGRKVREYQGHTGPVVAVAVSGDGRYALSGGWDKTLRLWRLPDLVGALRRQNDPGESPPAPAAQPSTKPDPPADKQAPPDQLGAVRTFTAADESNPVFQALNAFNRATMELHNVNHLLPTYRIDESRHKEDLLVDVLVAKREAEKIVQQLTEIEIPARATFKQLFLGLPALPKTEWRVALSQKPFTQETPLDMEIRQEQGKTRIRNDASRPSYDAYLDYPLLDDTRLKIRFSFPRRLGPSGHATGPFSLYFGVRDEHGFQQDLFSFPSISNPDEVHEILLARHGDLYTGMHKERARGMPPIRFKRFKETPRVFFHVHGPAEVLIHSVHAQPIRGPQPLAESTDPAGKQTLSALTVATGPAAAPAEQDAVSQVLAVLAQGVGNLHNISYLLRVYREEQSREKQKLQADLADCKEELEKVGRHFTAIADQARADFRKRFDDLPPLTNPPWRATLPQEPLTTEMPEGITIRREEDKTLIQKETVRASCHICLDYPLLEDTQLKIRFSLPARERRGGTLSSSFGTDFGIRDESGQQQSLFSFPANSNPDEIHEILVDRHGELFTAMYKERALSPGPNQQVKFTGSPLIHFSVSGSGEVVIHSVHARHVKTQNE